MILKYKINRYKMFEILYDSENTDSDFLRTIVKNYMNNTSDLIKQYDLFLLDIQWFNNLSEERKNKRPQIINLINRIMEIYTCKTLSDFKILCSELVYSCNGLTLFMEYFRYLHFHKYFLIYYDYYILMGENPWKIFLKELINK